MGYRSNLTASTLLIGILTVIPSARAAPEAHLLRVDTRAMPTEGGQALTTLIDIADRKRLSDVATPCAALTGDAHLDCLADRLEQPGALYAPIETGEGAVLLVRAGGRDVPGSILSAAKWGRSAGQPGVGTAWLIALDASDGMGSRFDEAKAVAAAFIDSLRPGDLVNIVVFGDTPAADSRWLKNKAQASQFLAGIGGTFPARGRTRPLTGMLSTAIIDAFADLAATPGAPMHQALVVLSNGSAGLDASSSPAGALELRRHLTEGRVPESNTAISRRPIPIVSIWFPRRQSDELAASAREYMENLANPEIGGFFDIVRNERASRAPRIVAAVRRRFDDMLLVRFKVPEIAPTLGQTLHLVFPRAEPPIRGDAWVDVPVVSEAPAGAARGPAGDGTAKGRPLPWGLFAGIAAGGGIAAALLVATLRRRRRRARHVVAPPPRPGPTPR